MPALDSAFYYLPVSSVQVGWGTYLAGVGRTTVPPNKPYPAEEHPPLYMFNQRAGRTLPEFQIVLISDGKGIFESEEAGAIEFDSPAVMFLFPDVWHRYRPDPRVGWTENWISFNGELIHRFMDSQQVSPKNPVISISEEAVQSLVQQYDDILMRIHENPTENSLLYSFHMMGLISVAIEATHPLSSEVESESQASKIRSEDPVVIRAMEIIWTHSNRPLSITEIAKRLPVTRRTLDRRFVESTGHTVLEEINRCRLARAKRLLRETKLPIKALAHLSGFASQERLRVSFLESEGLSPSEFRARCVEHTR